MGKVKGAPVLMARLRCTTFANDHEFLQPEQKAGSRARSLASACAVLNYQNGCRLRDRVSLPQTPGVVVVSGPAVFC